MRRVPLCAVLILALPAVATAQVVQPAESAASRSEADKAKKPDEGSPSRLRSWEVPPVFETVVQGKKVPKEDERIGDAEQPRWTATRRFPTTRVYVLPKGVVQIEWWNEYKIDLSGENPSRYRSQYEIEIGLPLRFQLDLYLSTEQLGREGSLHLHEEKVELRWALARWGVIPANPTLYLEWVRQHEGPQKLEGKLLLGGNIRPRWHFGVNLVGEFELYGDAPEDEYQVTGAVSYTVVDMRFSVGAEVQLEMTDTTGRRWAFDSWEVLAGPSLQLRPLPALHVDLVLLFGAEVEKGASGSTTSPIFEPTIVIGWEL
jgi:hypothetical protein